MTRTMMSSQDIATVFSDALLFTSLDGVHDVIETKEGNDGAKVEIIGSHRTTKALTHLTVDRKSGLFMIDVRFPEGHRGYQAALATFSATPEIAQATATITDEEILRSNDWS